MHWTKPKLEKNRLYHATDKSRNHITDHWSKKLIFRIDNLHLLNIEEKIRVDILVLFLIKSFSAPEMYSLFNG